MSEPALPIVVGLIPAGLLWIESEWVHQLFVLIALPISGYAIAKSITERAHTGFVLAASSVLALLIAGAFVEALHDYETLLTLAGALLLLVAHLFRWLRATTQLRRPQQSM